MVVRVGPRWGMAGAPNTHVYHVMLPWAKTNSIAVVTGEQLWPLPK